MRESKGKAATIIVGLALLMAGRAFAQQKTVEHKQLAPAQITVDTRDSTVAYIEGSHLVVKLPNGKLEAIQIPADERFNIDGQKLALHDLKPGMTLTDEVFTTTRPVMVKTVEISDGTVWFASARRLVIRNHEGELVDYKIPDWATTKINGEERPLHNLRRGQGVTATITTEEPTTFIQTETRSHGHQAPGLPKKSVAEIKPLHSEPAPVAKSEQPKTEAAIPEKATEPVEEKLPETGSSVPLIGLAGLLALAGALSIRAFRKAN